MSLSSRFRSRPLRRATARRNVSPAADRLPHPVAVDRHASIGCVIPCHNYAQFVAEAIESAMNQTDPYDAIVVVDDGSTDESAAVIAQYADQVQIVTQPNTGVLGACLVGIARLDTDYVHVLDADDVAAPNLVERARPLLVRHPVKLQFPLQAVNAVGIPNGSVFPSFAPGYDTAAMRHDNCVVGLYQCPPTSGNIFRIETLRRLPLDKEDPRSPLDGAGCAVMPYLGDIVSVPEELGSYRLHGASFSNADLPLTLEALSTEMEAFTENWASACRIIGLDEPPFGDQLPLYLLERRQFARVLEGQPVSARDTAAYLRRLARSNLPGWQRIVQTAWMLALHVPSPALGERLIALRRSGSNRPEWAHKLISHLRG